MDVCELLSGISNATVCDPDNPEEEDIFQVAIIREIYGNPFRPVSVKRGWLATDAVALAKGIYDKKAVDWMPILADALQDADCNNADILTHCRGDGPHVRKVAARSPGQVLGEFKYPLIGFRRLPYFRRNLVKGT